VLFIISLAGLAEALVLRRQLGALMAEPLYEIVMHIVRQYPDLDPDAAELSRSKESDS